jgi:hypothetical protein
MVTIFEQSPHVSGQKSGDEFAVTPPRSSGLRPGCGIIWAKWALP